ncbi:MAG: cation:proton antiporter [Deltaproteobacteria bacterium]|nr:cation:proton antiporter [Deltaproteobacteria bacterium]MBN2672671.1 cation:proton antiporter [Deltaproteobacteria bacterium]
MLLLVGIQDLLHSIVVISAVVMLVGFLLKILRQPSVISYIIVGVVLGPGVLGIVEGSEDISAVGSLGLVLLLFFVGMEMSLPKLIANWRISVVGTGLQVGISLLVMFGLGYYAGWNAARIIMMGFVLTLSSTAVILKLLSDWNEMQTTFVYVGMIIELPFLWENVGLISILVVSVFVLNTIINGLVFLAFNIPWRQSIYAGALLSQVGEFSFVLGTVGLSQHIITGYTFQLIISTIALTLFFSPAWIFLNKKLLRCDPFEK